MIPHSSVNAKTISKRNRASHKIVTLSGSSVMRCTPHETIIQTKD